MHEIRHLAANALMTGHADDPDIRILRRVSTLDALPLAPRGDGPIRTIAVVVLEVDTAGEIVGIASAGQALRDPGIPIPEHITRLTGITDDDVRGKTIDLDRLERRLAAADVRIAHNARFDIAFLQSLLPGLAGASWACSASDFDWVAAEFDGYKQGHLLMQLGFFNTAHRAMADVISLIHLLSHRLPHGQTVLGALLANAEKASIRFEATAAPFDRRSLLKARGYRWDARQRVWWSEIDESECAAEERWFRTHIAPTGPVPRMLPLTWHERHR